MTTITPHMMAVPNNHVDSLRIMQTGWLFGAAAAASVLAIGTIATGGLLLLGVGALAAAGVGLGAAAGGKVIADEVLKEGTGTGIMGNFIGNGIHGGLKMPVKIMPLMRQGVPFVASLRGYGRAKNRGLNDIVGLVFERLGEKAADIGEAYDFFWEALGDTQQGFKDLQRRFAENPELFEELG
jgi:hypothetical protein